MAIASALTTRSGDVAGGTTTPSRTGSYNEAYAAPLTNKEFFFADEGSYFTAITPASGTGIIGHAAPTTYDTTKPYIFIYNGTQKTLYPQHLALYETVASVGGVGLVFVPSVDNVSTVTTPGTTLTVASSNVANATATSGLVAQVGAIVTPANSGSSVQYGDIIFRGTIDIIQDHYDIVFGAPSSNGGGVARPATLMDSSRIASPIAVPPGWNFKLVQWRASQSTGPTFQVRLGFVLR
jgi:hypothetical protein